MKIRRAILIVSLALVVVILHLAGFWLQFYWRITWYDHLVHTLAGATAVLGIFSLGFFRGTVARPLVFFGGALAVSLAVGILWEYFELRSGITVWNGPGYFFDTAGDLVYDVVGGFGAAFYLWWVKKYA